MAYDKVVDSAILDAGLKQIADAIREKGGTSDNLAFPAGFAEAIAAIESGGGVVFNTGEVTYSQHTQLGGTSIEHGCGKTPIFCGIVLRNGVTRVNYQLKSFLYILNADNSVKYYQSSSQSTSLNNFRTGNLTNDSYVNDVSFTFYDDVGNRIFPSGNTYLWFAVA